jgi:glycosyltransferase involved in cell wall biosynthesis
MTIPPPPPSVYVNQLHTIKRIRSLIAEKETIAERHSKLMADKEAMAGRQKRNTIEETPAISVIVPVYNTVPWLWRCLDSVCCQTLWNIEIICVNDGSTDNSLEILREYEKEDKGIKIINFAENRGPGSARNAGIDAARGEYIGLLDSDDWVDADFYEKLYKKALDENADMAKSNLELIMTDGNKDKSSSYNTNKVKESKHLFTHAPTAIYRKNFLNDNKIRYPPGLVMLEDIIFEVKSAVLANKIVVVEDVYYHYIRRENSVDVRRLRWEQAQSIVQATQMIVDFVDSQNLDPKIRAEILDLRYYSAFLHYPARFYGDYETRNMFIDMMARLNRTPRQIFYVWFGGPKSVLVNICIENWKQMLPQYKIIEINEHCPYFNLRKELANNLWFKTVYGLKLWAYVSDYVRLKVLYDYGGVYLDTDITIYKDFMPLLEENMAFIGMEDAKSMNCAILGFPAGHFLIKKILEFYDREIWEKEIHTIPAIVTYVAKTAFGIEGSGENIVKTPSLTVYPPRYFYPFGWDSAFSPECITGDTYTVHWWNASWHNPRADFFLLNKSKMPLDDLLNIIDEKYPFPEEIINRVKISKKILKTLRHRDFLTAAT